MILNLAQRKCLYLQSSLSISRPEIFGTIDCHSDMFFVVNIQTIVDNCFTQYLPASLANDGHKNFLQYQGSNCAHTNVAVHPWWTVDLGVKLIVAGVEFTNRGDEQFAGTYITP